MASSKHGRGERPGAKPDPISSSGVPKRDKTFLESLRDSKGEDWNLSTASRRLRDLRSKGVERSSSSGPPAAVSHETAGPRQSERTFEVLDQVLGSGHEPDTLETPRVPGVPPSAPPRTLPGERPMGKPLRPTEERLRKAKRARRRTGPQRTRPARGAVRRVKRTVKRVDPWSVLKMSLFYYSIFFVVWLIGVAILFSLIESTGVFQNIEDIGNSIEVDQLANFKISLGLVLKWAAYIGAGLVLLATIVNVILAFLYNLGSDIVGGIEVTFVERDG